jgi:hypothetical protein
MTDVFTPPEQTLFEGLNARKLSPSEIAASFVMPEQFRQLIGPDHTLLIGPRGSGKTTLLRMLQGESLIAWEGAQAERARSAINYSSIFVPSDRLWASQVAAGASSWRARLGEAAFTTQVLIAFIETLLYRLGEYADEGQGVFHPVTLEGAAEADLVAECADGWGLATRGRTLFALQGALDRRLAVISDLLDGDVDQDIREELTPPLPQIGLLAALRLGIRSVNRHTRKPGHRWALLLDEMELAPQSIHSALTASLRGGEQNLILKLSFSPYDRYIAPMPQVGGAVVDHDYVAIYLSAGQRGTRRFTNELLARMMKQNVLGGVSAARALGHSRVDNSGQTWREQNYGPESEQSRLIGRLRQEDPSFAKFLERRGIHETADLHALTYAQMSSTIRKAYPLLVFRDALMHQAGGLYQRRTDRSKPTAYFSGNDAVIAALEGNPRWIKATFSQMLAAYDAEKREIPRPAQYDVLVEAARRFESLLRQLPPEGADPSNSVLDVVDTVARYFSTRTLGSFTADPPSVFLVDVDDDNEAVLGAIRAAVTAGALIHVRSDTSPPVLSDVMGERFRVAHLLTVRRGYEVPFRLGKSISLSRILRAPHVLPPSDGTLALAWEEDQ